MHASTLSTLPLTVSEADILRLLRASPPGVPPDLTWPPLPPDPAPTPAWAPAPAARDGKGSWIGLGAGVALLAALLLRPGAPSARAQIPGGLPLAPGVTITPRPPTAPPTPLATAMPTRPPLATATLVPPTLTLVPPTATLVPPTLAPRPAPQRAAPAVVPTIPPAPPTRVPVVVPTEAVQGPGPAGNDWSTSIFERAATIGKPTAPAGGTP